MERTAVLMGFGVGAIVGVTVTVPYKHAWQAVGVRLERHVKIDREPFLTVMSGVALGVLASLSSIGAGAIGATLTLLLNPCIEADIAHAIPFTLVAGIGPATLGHVDWTLLAALLVGSLPGICLGAHLTRSLPDCLVRTLLCVSLVTAGSK